MAYSNRQRRQKPPEEEIVEHMIALPEALLAWASTPEVAARLQRDWAHDIRTSVASWGGTTTREQFETILGPLDALVGEAIRARRFDLFAGMDLFLAEWLGVRLVLSTRFGIVEIGRDAPWSYGEVRALIRIKDSAAVEAAVRAKTLLAESFPAARIGSVEQVGEPDTCASCQKRGGSVMIRGSGGNYCRDCWTWMTEPKPFDLRKGKKAKGKR